MKDIFRLLMVLTIAIGSTGCSERSQEPTAKTVSQIQALARVGDTRYLGSLRDGLFQFNNKNASWKRMRYYPNYSAYTFAVNDTTLYVGGSGIFRLEPDGETFTEITLHSPDWLRQRVTALTVEGATIYAIFRNILGRSVDGGLSWHQIHPSGEEDVDILNIAVKENTIYALTEKQQVFVSTDNGLKWSAINGLDELLEIPAPPSLPLLLSQNTLYIGTTAWVYRLPIDSMTAIPTTGFKKMPVFSLAASETALYACVWQEGVFCSADGGKSWRNIGLRGVNAQTLAVFDNRLYVGTWGGDGVFYTADEGKTWHPLNKGLNFVAD